MLSVFFFQSWYDGTPKFGLSLVKTSDQYLKLLVYSSSGTKSYKSLSKLLSLWTGDFILVIIRKRCLRIKIQQVGESFNFGYFKLLSMHIINRRLPFSSESYKLSLGQWSFFALVLDGTAQQGLLQLDYAYGYNNGTADFKVLERCFYS